MKSDSGSWRQDSTRRVLLHPPAANEKNPDGSDDAAVAESHLVPLTGHPESLERANIQPPLEERCRISASKLIEAWAMAMKPERRKAFEAALDSLKEDELRALEGLTVVRMEHKDIEMIAHAMGEIVRLKMKERGII